MMMLNQANRVSNLKTSRTGFTLIELVVVIGILLALVGIVVLFFPSMQEQTRAARGASLLQGWLQVAKTRALRDRAPRGLRLWQVYPGDTGSPTYIKCSYLEQPDDFFGGLNSYLSADPAVDPLTVNISNVNFLSVPPPVKAGDYLEIGGVGNVFRIQSISGPTSLKLSPTSPIQYKIAGTNTYRIIRAPALAGDEILELPSDVAVDISNSGIININPIIPLTPLSGNVDIMFSPSGAVANNQITKDIICLRVGDVTGGSVPTLIGVHVRSGMIVAHPVSPGADPFSFVRDGKSSGL